MFGKQDLAIALCRNFMVFAFARAGKYSIDHWSIKNGNNYYTSILVR
jgi:uncharacterized membrane protein YphA (DoxX/SURF4 family)